MKTTEAIAAVVLALIICCPQAAAAGVAFDYSALLECRAGREEFSALQRWLTPAAANPDAAKAGISRVQTDQFLALFHLPKPVKVFGYTTQFIAFHDDGLLAVIDGIKPEDMAAKLKLDVMLPGHPFIAEKIMSGLDANGRPNAKVVVKKIVTDREKLNGKSVAGCLYIATE